MTDFDIKIYRHKIKVEPAFWLITRGAHFVGFDAVSQAPVQDFFKFDKIQMIFMGQERSQIPDNNRAKHPSETRQNTKAANLPLIRHRKNLVFLGHIF